MITVLASIGALVVVSILIRTLAQAVQTSGLEELSLSFRFRGNQRLRDKLNQDEDARC